MARRNKKQPGCSGTLLMLIFYLTLCAWLLSLGISVFLVTVVLFLVLCTFVAVIKWLFKCSRPFLQKILEVFRMKEESGIEDIDTKTDAPKSEITVINIFNVTNSNSEKLPERKEIIQSIRSEAPKEPTPQPEEDNHYKMSDYQLECFARECNAYLAKQERKEAENNMK